jgi:predicted alpha/beta-hydrolase family hydrolase
MRTQLVTTASGPLRLDWFDAPHAGAVVAVGHGSATGVEAGDLQALANALPAAGFTVALITYPYRLTGRPEGREPSALDEAFAAAFPELASANLPVVAGGRSAGAQVACRMGRKLGAAGVLALAYPILGPGSTHELLATGLQYLVVQGTNDPFGAPEDFPDLGPDGRLLAVSGAAHMLRSPGSSPPFQPVVDAALMWLRDDLLRPRTYPARPTP